MSTLTAEELREIWHYDPDTGSFTWRKPTKIGRPPGTKVNKRGYVTIMIRYKNYFAHRLAWLYMTGEWPKNRIDHINGVGSDNRFCNLRDVTVTVNAENQRRPRKDNGVGFLGVAKNNKRFMAKIKVNGKFVYLGTFDTPEEAHAAYLEAKRQMHVGCAI